MKLFLIGLLLITADTFAQVQNISINNYLITVDSGKLVVKDESDRAILQSSFNNPVSYAADLDNDSSDELIIIDSAALSPGTDYLLYIYNTIDSFYLADSINSGSFEPYYTLPEELNELVIITGNNAFTYLNKGNESVLPINCWKYESGELYNINDEIYDLFIGENEALTETLDYFFDSNGKSCTSSEKMKGTIGAIYSNYINAGEQSLASQFLKNYYLCPDLEQFRGELDELLLNQEY